MYMSNGKLWKFDIYKKVCYNMPQLKGFCYEIFEVEEKIRRNK